MDRYIGKRLEGRYDILELIGTGGMANVYRSYDIIDERTVAVKILRDEFMNNEDFVRRFKNESKAIALLDHPNIVRVYDVSFSDTQSIVMEYIDGVTLKEYIEYTGALPWKDAVHFTIQVLHAIQHAHDKGIVHRDIKPQNIMLLRSGEIKVTDFGIARFARSESRTISDRAIGSVHYISPEQALGEQIDDRTDIYSTGIMLFEMITGQLPFEADTAVSVAIKQIQSTIRRPTDVNPSIPKGLEEITLKAVQKDSNNRYQSAAEMILALEGFRRNPEIKFNYVYNTALQPPEPPEPKKALSFLGRSKGSKQNKPQTSARRQQSMMTPNQDSMRRSSYLRMMMLVTLAVIIGTAGFVGLMLYLNNPLERTAEDKLPNLIGQNLTDAENLYPNFKLDIEVADFNDDYAKGVIYDQRPTSGMYVKVGSTVRLWVSEGQKTLEIPDITDTSASRMVNQLRDLGLSPNTQRINHETIAAGRIIYTDPPAGQVVSGGSEITVYISEGPEKKFINVPDLVGLKQKDAEAMITQRDFKLGSVKEEASDLPEGTVSKQDPPAGSMQTTDTPINLTISKGGLTRFALRVPLPVNMKRDVLIRARIGDGDRPAVADEESLNPSEEGGGYWTPTFALDEGETKSQKVAIYVDGTLYQEYILYSDGSHDLVKDRARASEFQQ